MSPLVFEARLAVMSVLQAVVLVAASKLVQRLGTKFPRDTAVMFHEEAGSVKRLVSEWLLELMWVSLEESLWVSLLELM
ncbi:hypothetical protein FACS1894184_19590 [Clostridia bacterium]|nr:hypothetical protein FACS1894184_19590 [Clostridia bacterium]